MTTVLVGRQPIYTRQLDVFAYELLFRNGTENKATFVNGDEATSQVILHACVNIGLDNLVGQKLAFINMTRDFILSESFSLLPAERIVVEVLENTDAFSLEALERATRETVRQHPQRRQQRLIYWRQDRIYIAVGDLRHATQDRLFNGRSYESGDRAKPNNVSMRPLTQASLRCKRWLKPSSLHRIPTPLRV